MHLRYSVWGNDFCLIHYSTCKITTSWSQRNTTWCCAQLTCSLSMSYVFKGSWAMMTEVRCSLRSSTRPTKRRWSPCGWGTGCMWATGFLGAETVKSSGLTHRVSAHTGSVSHAQAICSPCRPELTYIDGNVQVQAAPDRLWGGSCWAPPVLALPGPRMQVHCLQIRASVLVHACTVQVQTPAAWPQWGRRTSMQEMWVSCRSFTSRKKQEKMKISAHVSLDFLYFSFQAFPALLSRAPSPVHVLSRAPPIGPWWVTNTFRVRGQ